MEQFDTSEFRVPGHLRSRFHAAKTEGFELARNPIRLAKASDEFVYGYSFRRDREQFRHTWSRDYPFRRRRHLMKIGKATGDPREEIKGQFPARSRDGELLTRSVPEFPQIEIVIYVVDAERCEQRFHDYVRAYQYLGGAGTEFFHTNSTELLRFCRIWVRNRKQAERMAAKGDEYSKQHLETGT